MRTAIYFILILIFLGAFTWACVFYRMYVEFGLSVLLTGAIIYLSFLLAKSWAKEKKYVALSFMLLVIGLPVLFLIVQYKNRKK
jgi:hypothetical protein